MIFWILDIIMIIWTLGSLGTFRGASGVLILIEEFLLLVWHACQWIFFLDYEKNKLSDKMILIFAIAIFASFLLVIFIEFLLIFMSLGGSFETKVFKVIKKTSENRPETQNSDDFEFDASSDFNMDKKVENFNTMKGKKTDTVQNSREKL